MMSRIIFAYLTTVLFLNAGEAFAQSSSTVMVDMDYPVAEWVVPLNAKADGGTQEEELMARIAKNVAPTSWESSVGSGQMRYSGKGYTLHVRQTPAIHEELKAYLTKIQRGQVAIEIRVISTALGLDYLQGQGAACGQIGEITYAVLTPRKLAAYESALQRDRTSCVMMAPKITCFEGQEATLEVGDILNRIGVDFDGARQKAPELKEESIFLGTQARFVAAIAADGRTVTVQTKILTRKLFELQPAVKPPPANAAQANAAREPSPYAEFNLAAIATIPDGRTVAFIAGKEFADGPPEPVSALSSTFSRVPYVSRLFRNQAYGRIAKTTIYLITPNVIREGETVRVAPLRGEVRAEDDGKLPSLR